MLFVVIVKDDASLISFSLLTHLYIEGLSMLTEDSFLPSPTAIHSQRSTQGSTLIINWLTY